MCIRDRDEKGSHRCVPFSASNRIPAGQAECERFSSAKCNAPFRSSSRSSVSRLHPHRCTRRDRRSQTSSSSSPMTWATRTPGATAPKCARRTVLRGVTRAILPADHELRTGLSALRRVCRVSRACVRTFPVQKKNATRRSRCGGYWNSGEIWCVNFVASVLCTFGNSSGRARLGRADDFRGSATWLSARGFALMKAGCVRTGSRSPCCSPSCGA